MPTCVSLYEMGGGGALDCFLGDPFLCLQTLACLLHIRPTDDEFHTTTVCRYVETLTH